MIKTMEAMVRVTAGRWRRPCPASAAHFVAYSGHTIVIDGAYAQHSDGAACLRHRDGGARAGLMAIIAAAAQRHAAVGIAAASEDTSAVQGLSEGQRGAVRQAKRARVVGVMHARAEASSLAMRMSVTHSRMRSRGVK